MERFIRKLQSMRLAMPGAIGHFCTMQVTLTYAREAKRAAANLSTQFHQDIKLWRNLCANMTDRPTYLADLFHWPASDIGHTNTSDLGDLYCIIFLVRLPRP